MTRAPGRLDVMGGIADYSGSLVLQVSTYFPLFFPHPDFLRGKCINSPSIPILQLSP